MSEDAATSLRSRLVGTWTVVTVDELSTARSRLQETLCTETPTPCAETEPTRSLLQDIVLVASELTANALEHAGGPARLDVVSDGVAVTVSVMDRSPDNPPVLTTDRELGEGGFGLQLTLRIADDVGWYRTPDGAKHVWARFVVTDPSPDGPQP
ncbi:ATP-binding protein [Isoptericola sp. S6320L]|uniref:ATP-binding protein n=1 Tax=Isoptericola sp. S6320L TaxID=2926411 RepID=UPI001FF11C1E|nr:ATP-binding protein [Isoptericola sp. S6320L]MCK0118592.1 ATP-binding protein [Isoptericola sp. S6320L]